MTGLDLFTDTDVAFLQNVSHFDVTLFVGFLSVSFLACRLLW